MWTRVGAAAGIVCWLVIFPSSISHGYPPIGASPHELVRWASSTEPVPFMFWIHVEDFGHVVLVFFLAWLCYELWRDGGMPWLLGFALASAAAWSAVEIATNGVWTAVLDAGRRGIDPQALAGIRDVAQELFNSSWLVFGPAVLALGLGGLSARTAPRWLGWSATSIGIAITATGGFQVVFVPVLVLAVWSVAVAIRYLIHPGAADRQLVSG
jgi:hypothetical protein